MLVLCLEGCHGCGKSSLCGEFEKRGWSVLDEAFLAQEEWALHPQSLVMETAWMSHWFSRLLRFQKKYKDTDVWIADRSPYSAVFYAANGNGTLLEPLIKEQVRELHEKADITVVTIYISVEKELLWARIQDRLACEPEREKYNEGSREWMETTVNFYESREWDYTFENNDHTLEDLLDVVIQRLSAEASLKDKLRPPTPAPVTDDEDEEDNASSSSATASRSPPSTPERLTPIRQRSTLRAGGEVGGQAPPDSPATARAASAFQPIPSA